MPETVRCDMRRPARIAASATKPIAGWLMRGMNYGGTTPSSSPRMQAFVPPQKDLDRGI